MTEDVIKCLILHGASQKIGDSFAGVKEVSDCIERVETVIENLKEGKWIDRAEGAVRTTVLAEALTRLLPDKYATAEAAAAAVKEWDDEKRKGASEVPQVKAEMEKIKAERAAERAQKAAKKAEGSELDLSAL